MVEYCANIAVDNGSIPFRPTSPAGSKIPKFKYPQYKILAIRTILYNSETSTKLLKMIIKLKLVII